MPEIISGYSRAMYANWLWHRPLHLLVDAGEGLQLALGASIYAPSFVALTHGHSDHILGLPGLIASRRFGKGAVDKPLTIVYPTGSPGVETIRDFLPRFWRLVSFPVTWIPLDAGSSYPLDRHRRLEAFAVTHVDTESSLGYRVVETRRRLKAAFADLPQAEIEARARRGERDLMMESFDHIVFAHSGDAMPIDPAHVRHATLLVHDATFLDPADRKMPIHATTEEAFAVARDAHVETLVLYHLSIRYDRRHTDARLRAQLAASGFTGQCYWLDDGRLMQLSAGS
jgi:ribonuclease Z